jgi:ATP-binding cassette, subfamily B, bacterial
MQQPPAKPGHKSLLRIYAQHTAKYPWLFVLLIGSTVVMQGAELAVPWFMRQFFNTLTLTSASPETVQSLLTIIGIVAGLAILSWIALRTQGYTLMYMESRVMTDLMTSTFNYLLRHSYNFFINHFAGSLTHRVSRLSRGYEIILEVLLYRLLSTGIFVIGAILVLMTRNVTLSLVLLGWVICFVGFQVFISKLRRPVRAKRAEEDSKTTGALADAIANQSTVALFSGVEYEYERFKGFVVDWRKAIMRAWHFDEIMWGAQGLLMIAINIGLLYGALHYWELGVLTIGDFVLIQTYLLGTFLRLESLNRDLRRFNDVYADANEMVQILNMAYEIKDKRGAKKLKVTKGEIWFDDVSFRFADATPVLEHFNLTIKSTEKIALVGPSGAGKSTVTKLLLRLYDVKQGAIKIDGQDISGVTQDSLRDAIAFVPQEPVLFHRTLMENIRYGRRDATDKEVIEAAKKAHCHEFISKQPEGYNTFVGERGIKLSGGERQRVAIARAILKDVPILVLDEATSSLDSESELLIQDALETLMQGKTVVVIAHRLSTIMKMDRIVVVEAGTIVAQGTHLELVNQAGLYRKLWSIQAGGFLGDGHKPTRQDEGDLIENTEELTEELAAEEKEQ